MTRLTSIALLTVSLSSVALAQQPVRPSAFEVATVKVNASGPGPSFGLMLLRGGRVFAQNVAVRDLIRAVYGLEDSQLEGVPAAMRSTRFDVEARIGGDATIDTARTMARTLLAERFRLVIHTETRQLPIYELMMARADRAPGRGLRASGKDCAPVTLPAGIPPAPPPPAGAGMTIMPGGFHCPSGLLPGASVAERPRHDRIRLRPLASARPTPGFQSHRTVRSIRYRSDVSPRVGEHQWTGGQ
jgi:hypothetical protein